MGARFLECCGRRCEFVGLEGPALVFAAVSAVSMALRAAAAAAAIEEGPGPAALLSLLL